MDIELVPRTEVLVLSAWMDGRSPSELRVRLLRPLGPKRSEPPEVKTTVEDTCEAVRVWLADFLRTERDSPAS